MDNQVSPLEEKLNELATLYVAARQLHSTLSLAEVGRQLSDVVGQLVGADRFVVYVVDKSGRNAKPCSWFNVPEEELSAVPVGEGPVGAVFVSGMRKIPDELFAGSLEQPMAVIPLLAEGHAIGAVSIISMLPHKEGWSAVDLELLRLLETHAGPALIAASLFQGVESPESVLEEAFASLPKQGHTTKTPAP